MAENENTPEVTPEATEEMTPEMLKKIIKQLEYYYGDYNLPRDRFLRQQVELDEGWVPLDLMMKFTRVAALAKKAENIAQAFEKIGSELIELSPDKSKIRRLPTMPTPIFNEELQKEAQKRTVYCKGFALDDILDTLVEFFSEFGKTETIQMRHYRDKKSTPPIKFKGSVFVVFKTNEMADNFMKLESVKYKDKELIRKWQADYNEEKRLERQERFAKSGKKDADVIETNTKPLDEVDLPTGSILYLSEIPEEVTREDIRSAIHDNCDVTIAFIDFQKGDKEGWVRLQGKDSAPKAIEKLGEGSKLELCGSKIPIVALSPEEEEPRLAKAKEFINNRKKGFNKGKGFRRGAKRRGGGRSNWRDSKRARCETDD